VSDARLSPAAIAAFARLSQLTSFGLRAIVKPNQVRLAKFLERDAAPQKKS
jgi:hypothetical protein